MPQDMVHDEEPECVGRCTHEGTEEVYLHCRGQPERAEEYRPRACQYYKEWVPRWMGYTHNFSSGDVLTGIPEGCRRC